MQTKSALRKGDACFAQWWKMASGFRFSVHFKYGEGVPVSGWASCGSLGQVPKE